MKIREFLGRIGTLPYVIFSGLLLGLTIVFPEVGLLAYIALIPASIAMLRRLGGGLGLRRAYLYGFAFFMSLDLVCFHWILYFYPLDFVGLNDYESLAVILLGWIGLSILQSVFSAFVFVLIALFSRTSICKRAPYLMPIYVAALFCVNEWTQTLTWAGVPWARIGISQTEMPALMQSASLFGSYFLTFIVVLFNLLIAGAIVSKGLRRSLLCGAICLFVCNLAFGTVVCLLPESTSEEEGFTIAAVQGNLPSQTDDLSVGETIELYAELTLRATEDGAELVFWPENVVGTTLDRPIKTEDGSYKKLNVVLKDLAIEPGASLVVGHFVRLDDETIQNSVSVFGLDGTILENVYSKMRPVPFGEYLPMKELITTVLPVLSEINSFGSDTLPGESSTAFECALKDGVVSVSTLICFDSIYDELGLGSSRAGAEILAIPSNDSWFYDSRALDMHHAQNILRAVEQGKYTISIGNTGITSVVNGRGEVVSELDTFTRDYLVARVYPTSARTLYSYIGNLFVYVCIALCAVPILTLAWCELREWRVRKCVPDSQGGEDIT